MTTMLQAEFPNLTPSINICLLRDSQMLPFVVMKRLTPKPGACLSCEISAVV